MESYCATTPIRRVLTCLWYFLVIDCARILQCSSNTLGKSPRGKLSIDLTCPLQKLF